MELIDSFDEFLPFESAKDIAGGCQLRSLWLTRDRKEEKKKPMVTHGRGRRSYYASVCQFFSSGSPSFNNENARIKDLALFVFSSGAPMIVSSHSRFLFQRGDSSRDYSSSFVTRSNDCSLGNNLYFNCLQGYIYMYKLSCS